MPPVDDLYRQVGLRIATERKARGMTQEQLAEAADLNASYLARIEAGARRATVKTLHQIALALETPIAHLFEPDAGASPNGLPSRLRAALAGLSRRDLELLARVARRFERSD